VGLVQSINDPRRSVKAGTPIPNETDELLKYYGGQLDTD
jgi:hypothetical protein